MLGGWNFDLATVTRPPLQLGLLMVESALLRLVRGFLGKSPSAPRGGFKVDVTQKVRVDMTKALRHH